MLNPIASEAIFSATYVDNYIDSVENLPDDVQRQLSRIRDIDVQYRSHLRDVDHYYDLWKTLQNSGDSSANRRSRAIVRMQQSLIQAQELGDEKMQIVNQLQELIDHKTRQLDSDQKNLDIKEEQQQSDIQSGGTPVKVPRTQSPTRENIPTNGTNSTEAAGCKELVMYNTYTAGNTVSSGNGASTPTLDRSVHASNGNAAQLASTLAGSGVQAIANNLNLSAVDSQRAVSKRSRRRNETVTQMELCGNESNSANEAGSSGAVIVGVDKNTLVGNIGIPSQKQSAVCGGSNATQKKNSVQGQGVSGAANAAATSGGGIGSGNSGGNNSGKKKKRKARGAQASNTQNTREETPPLDPIDPDEPTYCLCDQISFGEMILCDNDLCPIEWFHFSCVSLVLKPKGKWYCPNCRGDRPNVMKPKAQFLKELERYNKEKEEKT